MNDKEFIQALKNLPSRSDNLYDEVQAKVEELLASLRKLNAFNLEQTAKFNLGYTPFQHRSSVFALDVGTFSFELKKHFGK